MPQASNFNMVGENIDSRGKRRRGNLPKPVTDILRAWFHEHLDHPYPTEEDKQQFMQRTGLTLNQVSAGSVAITLVHDD
jgi:Homeobox KN domain